MLLEKNLKCELEIAPDTMIKCDVNKMQRVFDNLLRNAVNYSFDDSTIHIAVKQNGENLCIQFTNCGNTIPKEKLVRIFEQFYRLDVARSSRSGGAGLGLAVAKEIVELHNGTITAKSENEQIEFTVTLPLLQENRKKFRRKKEETCVDKQINETLVSGTIKVRETRVFCFCDVNSRSDPYGKKTVDTAFSVSAPTAAVAEEKMLLFENASGQKPLRRHYIR